MTVEITYFESRKDEEYARFAKDIEQKGYFLGPAAYWELLIADEDVEIEEGKPVKIKVKEIEFPEETVITLLGRFRHALGFVISLVHYGKPERVEIIEKVEDVVFLPLKSGKINKGELLGVVIVNKVVVKPRSVIIEKLSELDRAISIDPDVFVKSDWPYLWKK
ncbi:MAG: DUF22 domain-containing protein [Archaeoglobaceae archaeon]|nr:DUF22 domain-containing protein [Archaeoglobaceae archaeon]